jgi:uncharacterized membrane protein YjgN (DUF898 family)
MKNYFSFHLEGARVFKYFILMILIILVPVLIALYTNDWDASRDPDLIETLLIALVGLAAILGVLAVYFYIFVLSIQNIEYQEKNADFHGELNEYFRIIARGIALTIITIGIYIPWFARDLYSFFIEKSSYNTDRFQFHARAEKLLVIMVLGVVLPLIILVIVFPEHESSAIGSSFNLTGYLFNIAESILLAPYVFFFIKWLLNIQYRDYHIKFNNDIYEGIGVVLVQSLLSSLTFGIYSPLAALKIYQYFLQKSTIKNEAGKGAQLGYDLDAGGDFLYIWGQLLLTIITIGIYSPWAYTRVMKRVIGKTYLVEEQRSQLQPGQKV